MLVVPIVRDLLIVLAELWGFWSALATLFSTILCESGGSG